VLPSASAPSDQDRGQGLAQQPWATRRKGWAYGPGCQSLETLEMADGAGARQPGVKRCKHPLQAV